MSGKMCVFFSFITVPSEDKKYYFDWKQRQERNFEDCDSHGEIVKHYDVINEAINAYEYKPLTKRLTVDCQHGDDDQKEVLAWCESLDWKQIVEPLIIKPIINPFELPKVDNPTEEHIEWLKQWASVGVFVRGSVRDLVWDSVWYSVGDSVRDLVWYSVWCSVRDLVWDSVGDSVRDSVGDSVGAYISSFFDIEYKHDFTPAVKLWEAGLVPSYHGNNTWRLHSGENADVVYEWKG
jgi:hypothetical protein